MDAYAATVKGEKVAKLALQGLLTVFKLKPNELFKFNCLGLLGILHFKVKDYRSRLLDKTARKGHRSHLTNI